MRIGIHQPNFLPWMGYFYKIAQCDTFVLLDHVEYTKKSFTRRVKIHKPGNPQEEQYITIPLKKHSDHAPINSLRIIDGDKWQKKISAQIYQSYHKAPYFHQIEPLLERFFEHPLESDSFSELTIQIIKYISELLELKPNWITSSKLEIDYSGLDVNLDIVSHLGGEAYISGMGAKRYQDESLFYEKGIELAYSDFPLRFKSLDLPEHFLNKSILSYLASYEIDRLQEVIGI